MYICLKIDQVGWRVDGHLHVDPNQRRRRQHSFPSDLYCWILRVSCQSGGAIGGTNCQGNNQ